jgi:hypothetical protein
VGITVTERTAVHLLKTVAEHITYHQCLKLFTETSRAGTIPARVTLIFYPFLLIPLTSTVNDHDDPQSPLNQPSQGESNSSDSSASLFSVYYNAADIEDNKMVESWQKDAEGILLFVSPRAGIHSYIIAHKLERYRPVYSPPPLLHSSL